MFTSAIVILREACHTVYNQHIPSTQLRPLMTSNLYFPLTKRRLLLSKTVQQENKLGRHTTRKLTPESERGSSACLASTSFLPRTRWGGIRGVCFNHHSAARRGLSLGSQPLTSLGGLAKNNTRPSFTAVSFTSSPEPQISSSPVRAVAGSLNAAAWSEGKR